MLNVSRIKVGKRLCAESKGIIPCVNKRKVPPAFEKQTELFCV